MRRKPSSPGSGHRLWILLALALLLVLVLWLCRCTGSLGLYPGRGSLFYLSPV